MRTATYAPYNKKQRRFAGALSALFILSLFLMLFMTLSTTANAADSQPIFEYKIKSTSGSMPGENADCYTVEAGDTVNFEIDITNLTRPEMLSITSSDTLQFQEIVNMTAIDQNNQVIPWEYNNTVPIDNRIDINATGLPDNIYRLNVEYACTVLQSEALTDTGVFGEALYLDDGTTYVVNSADMLYGLTFKLTAVDSSKNPNTENFLDTGSYSLYYNSEMTRPVRFVKTGTAYQVVPEWDGRGQDHINIEASGTSNIAGLKSGVYYLAQTEAPVSYEASIGVIELALSATKNGSSVTTSVKILNETDIELYQAKLSTNANSVSIDYASSQTMLRQISNIASHYTMPILGLMLVGLGAAIVVTRKVGATQKH